MDAKQSLGEPRLLISRSALLHNARLLRKRLPPNVRICGMLKADAYGHGAALVADALDCRAERADCQSESPADAMPASRPAIDAIAVASIDEAAALPQTDLPVLVFRPVENVFLGRQRSRLEEAIRRGWMLTLCSTVAAEDVARIAVGCGKRANVQVMLDTGMSRSGVTADGFTPLLERIQSRPSLRLGAMCTHFANADDPDCPFAHEQLERFLTLSDPWIDGGRIPRHAANSGAIFFHPASHLDMVRPGISLYGIDPTASPNLDRALRPAMKWTAPLVGVKQIQRGVGVGYGQTWRAERVTRIGLVPIGYADGYPRCLSNRAAVMVHNRPAPVVGRVSMDLITIDLTDLPQAGIGDEVILLDSDPLSPASIYQLARAAQTIPYEIMCRIGPRVRRVEMDATPLRNSERSALELDDAIQEADAHRREHVEE